jgi:predicted ArsR family transcriptional regulator
MRRPDPLRIRVPRVLALAPMTCAEVARCLGAHHNAVSMHLRGLLDAGEVVRVRVPPGQHGGRPAYRYAWSEVAA